MDCFLSCATGGGNYISRIHARVIRTSETYELVDSSLRGVYVNDVRIGGKWPLLFFQGSEGTDGFAPVELRPGSGLPAFECHRMGPFPPPLSLF